MKKLSTIKRSSYNAFFVTKDGKYKFPMNLSVINFESKIDIENGLYAEYSEKSDLPTINELLLKGLLIKQEYIKTIDLDLSKEYYYYKQCRRNKTDFKAICDLFSKEGIKVSETAVKFIVRAWKSGFKAGYRGKGFHLFCASGSCNPLIIRATKLDKHFKNWQITYIC